MRGEVVVAIDLDRASLDQNSLPLGQAPLDRPQRHPEPVQNHLHAATNPKHRDRVLFCEIEQRELGLISPGRSRRMLPGRRPPSAHPLDAGGFA